MFCIVLCNDILPISRGLIFLSNVIALHASNVSPYSFISSPSKSDTCWLPPAILRFRLRYCPAYFLYYCIDSGRNLYGRAYLKAVDFALDHPDNLHHQKIMPYMYSFQKKIISSVLFHRSYLHIYCEK